MSKCTIGHVLIRNGKKVQSKLFNSLLTFSTGNRDWALKAYDYILNTLEPNVNFEKDEYGQPTFKDVINKYDVLGKLDQDKVTKDIRKNIKELKSDGSPKTYDTQDEAMDKARAFNKDNDLSKRYVANTVKVSNGDRGYEGIRWAVGVEKRNALTQLNTTKLEKSKGVNKRIREILNKVGVSIGALNELDKRLSLNGVMDLNGPTVDGMEQLIRIAEGVNGEQALPEEFAHFAFEAVINNPLAQRLLKIFETNPDLVEEVLGSEYEEYFKLYEGNIDTLKKEAIGKLISRALVKNTTFRYQNLLDRVIDAIKKFFSNIGKKQVVLELNQVLRQAELDAAELSNTLLTGSLDELMQLYVEGLQNQPRPNLRLNQINKEIKNSAELLTSIIEKTIIADNIYSKRQGGAFSTIQKERIDKLEAFKSDAKDLEGIMYFFNDYLSVNIQNALNKLDTLRKDPTHIDNYLSSAKILREAKNYIEGYNQVVEDARQLLNTLELESDPKLQEEFNKVKESVESSLDTISATISKFEVMYKNMLMPLLVQFYKPFLKDYETTMKLAKKGPKTINEIFTLPSEDNGFADRWILSMADNSDTISRLLNIAVAKADSQARQRGISYTKQLEDAHMKLEASGIKDTKWMYEFNSFGNPTGFFVKPYSAAYKNLNSAQKEYYDLVLNMRKEAIEKLPPKEGVDLLYLAPQIHKDWLERTKDAKSAKDVGKTWWETIKDPWIRREDDTRYGELINLSGEKISILPVHFINQLQDMNDLSLDATSGMAAFMGMYAEYDEMNQIVNALELTRDYVSNRNPVEYKKGQPIMHTIEYMGRKVERVVNKSMSDNRLLDRMNDFFDSNVYKQHIKDEGAFGRIAENLLIKYPALVNLSLNALTSISNVANAAMMTNIEAAAQEYFEAKHLAIADSRYGKLLIDYMGQLGNRVNNSKMQLLAEKFNIIQGDEGNFKNPKMREKGIVRFIKNTPLSFLQNCGEHYVQMRTGLAMLINYKLKDAEGNTISMLDALIEDSKSSKNNKKLVLKEGVTKLDGTPFTEEDRFKLETKIRYVSEQINGAYSQAEKGAIQQIVLGKAAMLFRRWMPKSYMRRFGTQKYEFKTDSLTEGYYRSMGRFATTLFKDLKQGQLLLNTRLKELSPAEKANLKRATTEALQFLAISLALFLLGMGDDDKDRPWLAKLSEYQLRRLHTELGAVFPLYPGSIGSLYTITQSPMAGMSTLKNLSDMLKVTDYFDVLESGPYKGHTKFYKYASKATPVWRQLARTKDPDIANEFLKQN